MNPSATMTHPVSTYRLQFHAGFTLADVQQWLPYLHQLGIKTIYASPIFKALPGSVHGYDALDPHTINPEIGTLEQLKNLGAQLKRYGMHWLQDIVPNHMAYDTRNPWVMDILEKATRSRYAPFFDVSWNSTVYQGKLMAPFLGSSLEEVIKKGELKLAYVPPRFLLQYYDAQYPLGLRSYDQILALSSNNTNEALEQLVQQVRDAHLLEETASFSERFEEIQLQLASLVNEPSVRSLIDTALDAINRDPARLLQLAEDQEYRLCRWQETDHRINYRRFFTINGLICLNIQDETVFSPVHRLVKDLLAQKIIDGLRIDHIDGLYDPSQYLNRVKELAGPQTYVVVEKILQQQEELPLWNIEGTTGYDFLSMVNQVLINPAGEKAFTQFYHQLVKEDRSIPAQISVKKAHILYQYMGGELENLYQLFLVSSLVAEEHVTTLTDDILKKTIASFLIHCPVYRFYGNRFPLQEEEHTALRSLLDQVQQSDPTLSAGVALLKEVFLIRPLEGDAGYNQRALHFYQRCMQFSGPLMAKGVEDTFLYTYNRFLSPNEVGDSAESFGISIPAFHQKMTERIAKWPLSLNATSTHDTKRGEDVRARLNVLTDLPDLWLEKVKEWMQLNQNLKQNGFPDVNDEYFIYQSLLGSYPMPGQDEADFTDRFKAYLQKAVREAKVHSNWSQPNEAYENALTNFAEQVLNKEGPFWKSFSVFHATVSGYGILNSLVQVVLKFTCPGVPDLYQGSELWDLSFVDPDNRRPVDFSKRMQGLNEVESAKQTTSLFDYLWEHRFTGQVKLWLVHRLLQERKKAPDLWGYGDYIPLAVEGKYKDHVLAFARRLGTSVCIIAVPLHTAMLLQGKKTGMRQPDWKDTRIVLPFALDSVQHLLEEQSIELKKSIRVKDLFHHFPFALLKAEVALQKRGAGILMPVTSLSSPFGVGDLGPEAMAFADFLYRSYQRYWQLLPLNPVERGQGYSPYSSTSSRAGNIWLISPELLAEEGLLDKAFLQKQHLPSEEKADYTEAEKVKNLLLDEAWKNFQTLKAHDLHAAFKAFREQEQDWLDDFAVYTALKQMHKGAPWYEWPEKFKHKDEIALQEFRQSQATEIEKIQWMQFVFFRQWKALKNYCNAKSIRLIGDLPFYVSYDSADVWSHRDIFLLDAEGKQLAMAGVPPDAFSEDGQLWGMPVFNWEALKTKDYDWWIKRLQKNVELFDLVRLDHFRAFSAYWEVPAGANTARHGRWKKGPGAPLFRAVKKAMGTLPFIAEDLGEIDEPVYQLRDQFGFPGMNVLQFAFGGDMARSNHIPHNYIRNSVVYTGTHDNNTTVGWFKEEKQSIQKRLEQYTGRNQAQEDVAAVLCRMAYASVADIVILPIQDVLELDERARINTPSSAENNWVWRLVPGQINAEAEKKLRKWARIYNRI